MSCFILESVNERKGIVCMIQQDRNLVVEKITEMFKEQVLKVLIFMAGMEAEHMIQEGNLVNHPKKST